MPDRRLPGERLAGEIATAVARNIDVDEIVRRIDVQAAVDQIDLDRVVAKVDIDAIVARIDIDAIVARIDIGAIVDRIDIEAIAQRVPIERIVGTEELQRAVDHLDLGPALRRAGLADIVADSVGRSTVDTVRRRVVVFDALGERLTGRLLRQDIDSWPAGPHELVGDELGPLGELDGEVGGEAGWDVSGHYVGPVARILAAAADVAGAVGSWSLITSITVSLAGQVGGASELGGTTALTIWAIGLFLWLAGWFLLPLEVVGRTPAMSLLGMRVVTADGRVPGFWRLLRRTLLQAPSTLLFGVGYLVTLFDRHRRTAHDRLAGTVVVWDWGDRQATIASPMSRWVAGNDDRDRA